MANPTIAALWLAFRHRRAVLGHPNLSLRWDQGLFAVEGVPGLREAAMVALYFHLTAVLEAAISSIMLDDDLIQTTTLAQRLRWLNRTGQLANFDALSDVSRDFAQLLHPSMGGRPIDEHRLDGAIKAVQYQLVAWELIDQDQPPITIEFKPGYERYHLIRKIGPGDLGIETRVKVGEDTAFWQFQNLPIDEARIGGLSERLSYFADQADIRRRSVEGTKDRVARAIEDGTANAWLKNHAAAMLDNVSGELQVIDDLILSCEGDDRATAEAIASTLRELVFSLAELSTSLADLPEKETETA